ncbi:MAG: 30S ribosomal protein S12 methylthiotransferase RimO [Bacteroidaceae bacterium]|nr:30S ribosomal protein S12 methylthiotransferase RimO [Bacteroidaceae bacterium]
MRIVDIITMGCSKNLVDSEKLLYQLQRNGIKVCHNPVRIHHDVVVVNTCGFINDAKEESIQMILSLGEMKQRGKIKKLYVMGCLSERFFSELSQEIPEVDKYFGKFNWHELLKELNMEFAQDKANERQLTTPRHYAYLKISEGCNRHCAYCAIPIITGSHRSRSMEDILDEVKILVAGGVKEFQVIAQELTYYGLDLYGRRRLPELIQRISDVAGVEWIRLHYGYPNSFPYEILPVMRERDNVCKYLDIALQHSSDRILQRMHRNTSRQYQKELVSLMREEVPEIALRTTFMVGYPGETDEDFQDLVDFVKWARFERMGAFAYSEEEGTFAAEHYADDVPDEVKRQRLDALMALQQDISEEICAQKVGKTFKTIIDRKSGGYYIGRTQYDSPEVDGEVLIPSAGRRLRRGMFYSVRITEADEFDLTGEVIR